MQRKISDVKENLHVLLMEKAMPVVAEALKSSRGAFEIHAKSHNVRLEAMQTSIEMLRAQAADLSSGHLRFEWSPGKSSSRLIANDRLDVPSLTPVTSSASASIRLSPSPIFTASSVLPPSSFPIASGSPRLLASTLTAAISGGRPSQALSRGVETVVA